MKPLINDIHPLGTKVTEVYGVTKKKKAKRRLIRLQRKVDYLQHKLTKQLEKDDLVEKASTGHLDNLVAAESFNVRYLRSELKCLKWVVAELSNLYSFEKEEIPSLSLRLAIPTNTASTGDATL